MAFRWPLMQEAMRFLDAAEMHAEEELPLACLGQLEEFERVRAAIGTPLGKIEGGFCTLYERKLELIRDIVNEVAPEGPWYDPEEWGDCLKKAAALLR